MDDETKKDISKRLDDARDLFMQCADGPHKQAGLRRIIQAKDLLATRRPGDVYSDILACLQVIQWNYNQAKEVYHE
jgi:hypothetical protein